MDNTDTEDYNQDESDAGEEDVKGPPPKFLNDPQKERKKQGESVEFKCDVANASEYFTIYRRMEKLKLLLLFFFFIFFFFYSYFYQIIFYEL